MPGVHLTRDRTYNSAAILKPQTVLWKTEGLFVIQDSYITTATVESVASKPSFAIRLPTLQNFTDPLFANGTIFFSLYIRDGYLIAHDAAAGKSKWSFKLKQFGLTAPVVAGNTVFVGGNNGTFYALAAADGKERWTFNQKGNNFFTVGPAVSNGTVFYTSSERGSDYQARPDGRIFALNAETGQQQWLFKTKGSLSSPAISGQTLYVGSNDGYLFALDSATGLERWKFKVSKGAGPPALMAGLVYFNDLEGNLFAVDAESGQLKWKNDKLPKTVAMLALANGLIYYSGVQHSVFAVDATSGQLKWIYKTKGACKAPVVAGGMVYFSSFDGFLGAVDALTGEEKWKLESTKSVPSSPIIVNGTLYFLTVDGNLYAVR